MIESGAAHVTYQSQMKYCRRTSCRGCRSGVPSHGPYWYAYWREEGRVRSRYLGRQPPQSGDAQGALPAPAQALRVRTLGTFAVWRGGEPVPPERWSGRTTPALFKILLGVPGHRLHREQIIDTLWPDAPAHIGMRRLRAATYRLRHLLGAAASGAAYLRWEGDVLCLVPGGGGPAEEGWLDATTFARLAAEALAGADMAACRRAHDAYAGDYLPEDLYEDWAVPRRQELRDRHTTVLLHLARLAQEEGCLGEAEQCLRAVLAADPCNETVAGALMELLASAGQSAEALVVYERLADAVRRDLDAAPQPTLRRARDRLLAAVQAPQASAFAPRGQIAVHPTNLPSTLSSFVGRVQARASLAALLDRQRLVTLTGIGGIGKTRLALQVAEDLLDRFPDGVWRVELAGVPGERGAHRAHLPTVVAHALGILVETGRAPLEALLAFLRPRQLLLVVDNCEHVIADCSALVHGVLEACPGIRVLATSREPLGVPGEQRWLVPTLALPGEGQLQPDLAARTEAVALFTARARAIQPSFALTRRNVEAVAQICARLDGIPLAIELASARAIHLDAHQIRDRLRDRFRLLTGGSRMALSRHQTLQAAMDWSYALLDGPERALLRRLAVFAGGWTLAAAERVCDAPPLDSGLVLDLLGGLVQHSLVLVEWGASSDQTRYRMLETVREYGLLQLGAANEQIDCAAAHRRWCLQMARHAAAHLRDREQGYWLDWLDAEHENLRAALAWSCAEPEADPGLEVIELAGAIWQFWFMRDHVREGRAWFDRLFAAFPPAPSALWAKALNGAGVLALHEGDLPQAMTLLDASRDAARAAGDRVGIARALTNLAGVYLKMNRDADAEARYEECRDQFRELDDRPNEASVVQNLAILAKRRRDYPRARTLFEQALAHWQALGSSYHEGLTLEYLADIAWRSGDVACASNLIERSLGIARELDGDHRIASALQIKGLIATAGGEFVQAADWLCTSLDMHHAAGDAIEVAVVLEELAGLFAALLRRGADTEDTASLANALWAAKLLGAAAAIRIARSEPVRQEDLVDYEADIGTIRQHMSEAAFADAWNAGAALSADEAVALARQNSSLRRALPNTIVAHTKPPLARDAAST